MFLVAAVAVVTAAPFVVRAPSPVAAETVSNCSTTLGVIVVVDFAHFHSQVERGCGADPSKGSTTGLQAMHTAGFATNGTAAYGTRFICRIVDPSTGMADPATTPCTSTPPSSAYWSYWHADPGQTTWSLSELGVVTYRPPPGSVTLWVFGGTSLTGKSGTGRPPATLTPTVLRATNLSPAGGGTTTTTTALPPTTTSPPSAGGTGGAPAAGGGGGTSAVTVGGAGSTGSGAAGGAGTKTTSPLVGSTTTTTPGTGAPSAGTGGKGKGAGRAKGDHRARAGPRIVDVNQGLDRGKTPSGSPLPVVVGSAAVVALAGTGGVIAWRRRRTGEAG